MTISLASRVRGVEKTLIRQISDSAPRGAINLGLGQPDLPTPEPVKRAGIRAIEENRTGYTVTAGAEELRAAIASRYRGFAAGPESVVVTVGSEEAVFLCCLALLDPGDEILVPDPGYPAYPMIARILGAKAVPYPLRAERGFAIDPHDLEPLLTPRSRLIIVNSPGNPTGALDHLEDLQRLDALTAERGITWLSDEIYSNYVYEEPFRSLASVSSRGIVVSSLSKELSMAGWRLGWIVGDPAFAHAATALHQAVATCAPSISQHAALVAFGAEGQQARREIRERFALRRETALAILAGAKLARVVPPKGSFYVFADVSAKGDSMSVCRALLDRGVITIPGIAFGARGEGWLRISFAADEADLERGLTIIRDYLS